MARVALAAVIALLSAPSFAGEWMTIVRDGSTVRSAMMAWQGEAPETSVAVSCQKIIGDTLPANVAISVSTPSSRVFSVMKGDSAAIRLSLGGAAVDLKGKVWINDSTGTLYQAESKNILAAFGDSGPARVDVVAGNGAIEVGLDLSGEGLATSAAEMLAACGL